MGATASVESYLKVSRKSSLTQESTGYFIFSNVYPNCNLSSNVEDNLTTFSYAWLSQHQLYYAVNSTIVNANLRIQHHLSLVKKVN